MFKFLMDNDLIWQYQSVLKRRDFCVNQLLPITHDIYKPLDVGLEVRAVFLNISSLLMKCGTRV